MCAGIAATIGLSIAVGPGVRAQGFDGDFFGPNAWSLTCSTEVDWSLTSNCGFIIDPLQAKVNLSTDPVGTGEAGDPVFISAWVNQAAIDTPYLLTFDLAVLYKMEGDPLSPVLPDTETFPVYGYYRVGSGPLQGNILGGSSQSGISVMLSPGDTFTFGLYSDNLFIGAPDEAQLSISNFTTTPVIPAPLPALGAAALCLGSRRLRRRQRQALRLPLRGRQERVPGMPG